MPTVEERLKVTMGDLIVQLTMAQARVEELEKQIAQKESGTGTAETRAEAPSGS